MTTKPISRIDWQFQIGNCVACVMIIERSGNAISKSDLRKIRRVERKLRKGAK